MPNVIYIQVISGFDQKEHKRNVAPKKKGGKQTVQTYTLSTPIVNETMVFPLFEDLKMEVSSEMSTFAEMIPGFSKLSSLIGLGSAIQAGLTGGISTGMLNLSNLFEVPRWVKTNPIKFSVTLPFFTITDARKDVYNPMKKIIDLTILSQVGSGDNKLWSVPGFSAATMKQTGNSSGDASAISGTSAKLIAVKIPGIIYMPLAIMKSASPTFSKHIVETSNGASPLWGELDCSIEGIYPALSTDFNGGGTVPGSSAPGSPNIGGRA